MPTRSSISRSSISSVSIWSDNDIVERVGDTYIDWLSQEFADEVDWDTSFEEIIKKYQLNQNQTNQLKLFLTKLKKPDYLRRIGYPDYELANNRQNNTRIKKRIEELEAAGNREHKEYQPLEDLKVIENVEFNRIQFIFDAKPTQEIRQKLKYYGFRWSPTEKAWQRQLNGNGLFAAKLAIDALKQLTQDR